MYITSSGLGATFLLLLCCSRVLAIRSISVVQFVHELSSREKHFAGRKWFFKQQFGDRLDENCLLVLQGSECEVSERVVIMLNMIGGKVFFDT